MSDWLNLLIRKRAGSRCEYCHMPESASPLKHVLDHIIARQHGGKTEPQNLALCCGRCNQFKGPNIGGMSAQGKFTRLFHPRTDVWEHHFQYEGAILKPGTDIAYATIAVLAINTPKRIGARIALMEQGFLL